jgi:hypothetical protein
MFLMIWGRSSRPSPFLVPERSSRNAEHGHVPRSWLLSDGAREAGYGPWRAAVAGLLLHREPRALALRKNTRVERWSSSLWAVAVEEISPWAHRCQMKGKKCPLHNPHL